MTAAAACVCICVCMEGKGQGGEGQCTLMRPTHNASFSQLGRSQGPAYLLPLPSQFSSIPYRIPLSGASGMGGRESAPPLMFSLGTGCCLFDFQ